MNGKRTASECDEILTKRAKVAETGSSEKIFLTFSDETSPECHSEPQSHGEPTFGAMTDETDDELDDLGIECFDDFERTSAQDRQPVAGNVVLGASKATIRSCVRENRVSF